MRVLLMCICLTVVTANEERCDGQGYFYSKEVDRCFKKHPGADWFGAVRRCRSEGASLLVMETLKEANYIRSLGVTHDYHGYGYVGVHDMFKEGTFITIHGDLLDELEYKEFNSMYGEPNHGEKDHCLEIGTHLRFNDIPCERHYPFYCEKDAKKLEADGKLLTLSVRMPSDCSTPPIIIMP